MSITHLWTPTLSHVHDEAPTLAPGTIRDEQEVWAIDGDPARDGPTHLGRIFTECRPPRPPDSRQDLLVPSTQRCRHHLPRLTAQ